MKYLALILTVLWLAAACATPRPISVDEALSAGNDESLLWRRAQEEEIFPQRLTREVGAGYRRDHENIIAAAEGTLVMVPVMRVDPPEIARAGESAAQRKSCTDERIEILTASGSSLEPLPDAISIVIADIVHNGDIPVFESSGTCKKHLPLPRCTTGGKAATPGRFSDIRI